MTPLEQSLRNFIGADLQTGAIELLGELGYASAKTEALPSPDAAGFAAAFGHTFTKSAGVEHWQRLELLFQLTGEEVGGQLALGGSDFDRGRFDSFLFFALDLAPAEKPYARGTLANMARELSKPFPMPVIVLFRHGQSASLASIHRRENKRDTNRDVLERVVLLKDIRLKNPHRAHLDILLQLQGAKSNAQDWAGFLKEWNRVLDISELNKKFYRDYKAVFDEVEAQVPLTDPVVRRDWTQRLFNRLMFVRFLEKKGWMHYNGDTNYLRALFEASKAAGETDFLNDRLFYAFFFGLGWAVDQDHLHSHELLQTRRGIVPYLNGGLFDRLKVEDAPGYVTLPNSAFETIFALFERYYFTVAESTPLDEEVGIDPEMLGKVFEELVTGRHETGSYYTPREIVSFMGREALKGYLAASGLPADVIGALVDDGEVQVTVPQARELLKLVETITICDPACGSGAYLLGMVTELVRLYDLLEVTGKARTPRDDYERKLQIIAKSIYGVDKDEFATNIAMLRLWLSLVIDYHGDTPEPLPNLKYKIEVGDSLAAPLVGLQQTFDSTTVEEFNQKKREYVSVHGDAKAVLESEIEKLRDELKAWSDVPADANIHDWRIEFAEIFEKGGFDIVLANPPYVRQELIKEQKPQLKKIFGDAFNSTADLYCYFYLRAFELLKDGGQLAFISPNKWFRAAYGSKLRAFFADNAQIRMIVDFGELRVFQTAATFPMIFLAGKTKAKTPTTFTQVKSLDPPYPDVRSLIKRDGAQLPETAFDGASWNLSDAQTSTRLATMRKSGLPLGEYVKGQIFYGIKTGFNEAFVIDETKRAELIRADAKSVELIKPMAKGDDVRRWRIEDRRRFLIVTKIGVEIKKYPAIFKHLKKWQAQLEVRADKGNFWWELRACAYYNAFEKPKIMYPVIGKQPRFVLDRNNHFFNDKAFMIAVDDLFLLGILNSSTAWDFFKRTCSVLGDAETGGRVELRSIYVEQLPIPTPNAKDKNTIESLAEACLAKRGADCTEEEAEINAIVAKLYGVEI